MFKVGDRVIVVEDIGAVWLKQFPHMKIGTIHIISSYEPRGQQVQIQGYNDPGWMVSRFELLEKQPTHMPEWF